MKEANELNKSLIASIGDGVIIVNEYGIITDVNSAATNMLGYGSSELIGQWLPKALPSKDKEGNDIPAVERPAVKSLLSGQAASEISTYVRKDGSLFPVAGTASPFIFSGEPRGSIIVFRDVSRETAVEKAKDEFVSLASHQLRTPLTSINLYLQLIKEDGDNSSQNHRTYLKRIEAAARSMLELVDDFLNVSKLELGRLEIRRKEVNLADFLADAVERIETVAKDNQIKLSMKLPDKPVRIITDEKLLTEAVHNLLTNAIRYRGAKAPKVEVSLEDKGKIIQIVIKDNGIGIPNEAKTKIFERLYRADNAKENQVEGTGLGLYLVRKIIEALAGTVSFESKTGRGTTFFIELPKK